MFSKKKLFETFELSKRESINDEMKNRCNTLKTIFPRDVIYPILYYYTFSKYAIFNISHKTSKYNKIICADKYKDQKKNNLDFSIDLYHKIHNNKINEYFYVFK